MVTHAQVVLKSLTLVDIDKYTSWDDTSKGAPTSCTSKRHTIMTVILRSHALVTGCHLYRAQIPGIGTWPMVSPYTWRLECLLVVAVCDHTLVLAELMINPRYLAAAAVQDAWLMPDRCPATMCFLHQSDTWCIKNEITLIL